MPVPDTARDPLQLIAEKVRHLADADVVSLVVPADRPGWLQVAVADGAGAGALPGLEYPMANSLIALAMDTGHGIRLDSFERAKGYVLHLAGIVDVDAVMAVPLSGQNGPAAGSSSAVTAAGTRSARSTWTWPSPSPARQP